MRHAAAILACLATALAPAVPARGDEVTLRNGATYRGAILGETPDALTLQSDGIAWTFRRTHIATQRRDAASRERELQPEPPPRQADAPRLASAARVAPVVLYGTSWCGWCRRAREFFTERGIPFVDKDVERDGLAARELDGLRRRAGIRSGGVPVIDVDGTVIVGFDQRRIEAALGRR